MSLVLVATPLGNMADLSPRAAAALAGADAIACEDTRRTGRLLDLAGIRAPKLLAVHEHNEASMVAPILERLAAGASVAMVSDAGMPGISDPGERIVRAAIAAGHPVSVIPGPSAAIAALAISGLPTDRWIFEGFVPRKGPIRKERLLALADEPRTAILYEAPHRLRQTLTDLLQACGPDRPVALARELTKLHEEVWRGSLANAVADDREPRGEYVIVLGGARDVADRYDDSDIEAALEAGGDVAAVSEALSLPKRRVYAVAVAMRARGNVPRQ